jgi:3-hydroxyisobutyrate dehydrogenase-like beta-hydroxyacid dehydrogenase
LVSIAVIGIGKIGAAVARAAAAAGHDVIPWNRSPIAGSSLPVVPTAEEAIRSADVAAFCLPNYEITHSVLSQAANIDGRCILQLATGTPQEARVAGEAVERRGGWYLDAKVIGGPSIVGSSSGRILLAGPTGTVDAYRDTLTFLGSRLRHVGEDYGAAATLDLSWLCQRFGLFLGLRQGIALSRASKVDLRHLADLFPEGDRSRLFLDTLTGDLPTQPHASLAIWNGALSRVIAAARDAGVKTELLEMAEDAFADAIRHGYGDHDVSSIAQEGN